MNNPAFIVFGFYSIFLGICIVVAIIEEYEENDLFDPIIILGLLFLIGLQIALIIGTINSYNVTP